MNQPSDRSHITGSQFYFWKGKEKKNKIKKPAIHHIRLICCWSFFSIIWLWTIWYILLWNFLIKTADKIWSKMYKGWKVSSLMPIMINWLDFCTFFAECNNALPWDKLIDPTGFPQQTVTTSKEEQLMNERKRCNPWGISGYQLCPKTGRVIFQVNGIQDWNFITLICSSNYYRRSLVLLKGYLFLKGS